MTLLPSIGRTRHSRQAMGGAVSLAADAPIDVPRAREIAGERWNDELAVQLEGAIAANGGVALKLSDLKTQFPLAFETEEEKQSRLEAEFKAILLQRSEGHVTINYQMYNEQFPVSGNTLTASRIDEDYGLSDVMPACRIMLSQIDSKARTLYSNAHHGTEAPWVREDPVGTFRDLLAGETYFCIVIEDPAQYAQDMQALAARLQAEGVSSATEERVEGCSCLYGNPCLDQYICRDWDSRFAVAKKNGWKGF
jgi:hypothetical protein